MDCKPFAKDEAILDEEENPDELGPQGAMDVSSCPGSGNGRGVIGFGLFGQGGSRCAPGDRDRRAVGMRRQTCLP